MSREPNQPKTIETTINLHRAMRNVTHKKRAPRAIKKIKSVARTIMKTNDVRIETGLNKEVWSKGVKNVPFRVRVRMSRKMNDDEDASEAMYTLVSFKALPKTSEGLPTVVVDE